MRVKWFLVSLATTVLLFAFCFAAAATPTPVITSIAPDKGFDNQQVNVTITGNKFYSTKTSVVLAKSGQSDIVADDVVVTKTSITCKFNLQGQTPGAWDVIVTNYGKILKKQRFSVLEHAFTIISSAPTIKSINPANAYADSQVSLLIAGDNYRPDAKVSLVKGDKVIDASSCQINKSGEQITAQLDLKDAAPDFYDVRVKNTDGSEATVNRVFEVLAKPAPPAPEPEESTPVAPPVKPEEPVQPAPAPAPVDPNSLLKTLFFDFDSATIRPDQTDALKTNLDVILHNKEGVIVLGGHADERGSVSYNLQLSAKRANAVKTFLIDNGIDAKRIVVYAYGETSPKKEGHDEEAWKFNRCVDIALWAEVPDQKDALKK